jgi:PKD repeat protein
MKLLLAALFSGMIFAGFAQQPRQDILIPVTGSTITFNLKSLEAKFSADVTQGVAPLTVQFTDQSTGSPTTWKWNFGDGDSSLVKNPSHTYKTYGIYTVKLTISDGINGFALEKKDYIRVTINYVNCDTLHSPLPEPLTYYTITDKGYVTGNNSYGDKAICDYFDNMQSNLVITGVICKFSKAKQQAGHFEKIPINIWKSSASSGKPGTVLRSDTIMLSVLATDVTNSRTTTLDFDNPLQPGGSFYMGAMLPVLTGDTLAFWSTASGKVPVNTTWILQSDNVWNSASVVWPSQGGLIISSAIYPKVCLLNAVDHTEIPLPFAIWPNPAQHMISIVNQQGIEKNSSYFVLDISGKELLKGSISESLSTTVDVSMLKPGLYILRISGKKTAFSSKLIIK